MRSKLAWIIAFAIVITCLLLGGGGFLLWKTLAGDPPGEGPKAEAGYKACTPIIKALKLYRSDKGYYPRQLNELVPFYLSDIDLPGSESGINYQADPPAYQLTFRYTGPGMNICVYTPETGWKCHGYY